MPITSTRLARRVLCARSFEKCGEEVFRRMLALLAATFVLVAGLPGQQKPSAVIAGRPGDAVLITVTRRGPYPASFKHSTKPFVLFVVNQSDVREETYSIVDDVTGVALPSLPQLHATASSYFDRALVQLPPGTYRLAFQSHPGWAVKITASGN